MPKCEPQDQGLGPVSNCEKPIGTKGIFLKCEAPCGIYSNVLGNLTCGLDPPKGEDMGEGGLDPVLVQKTTDPASPSDPRP